MKQNKLTNFFKKIPYDNILLLSNMILFMLFTLEGVIPAILGMGMVVFNFIILVDKLTSKKDNKDETLQNKGGFEGSDIFARTKD